MEKIIHIDGNVGMSTGILMRKGQIRVFGRAGRNTGVLMRSGRIVVMGSTDDFTGAEMRGGEIFIKGHAGCYACAGMLGGSIYAQSGKAMPPAKEHMLNHYELATVARTFELNPIHAMVYRRWGL
jgi:formylmethanofuran dehydrogenase subunit C